METPVQTCTRLLAALEDLAGQEAASLAGRDFAAVLQLQDRSAPLVAHLAAHGPAVADATLRQRIATWLAGRQRTSASLATEIAQAKTELQQIATSRRQAARVAPAYGRLTGSSRHLCVVG